MNENEKLRGLLREQIQEEFGSKVDELREKAAEQEETNAKLLEANKDLKAQYDAWQDKSFKLAQNTGEHKYIFKGYDTTRPTRNYRIDCSRDVGEEAAKQMLSMICKKAGVVRKDLTTANTGAYAVPVEYGDSLLGLAELQSYALSRCRVIRYPGEVMYLPVKNTRATVDAQAFGTANAGAALDLARLTFTIDKRVGGYETIYNNVLRQENFDVVGELVEPMLAEGIGQNFDGEMFKKTEFTTDITAGGTEGATFSGTIGDTSITYLKLIDVEAEVEQERGVNPEWVMPRGVFKYVRKLRDDNGLPLWERAMEAPAKATLFGYPLHIVGTSAISATPANGTIALAFGDPKRYIIAINQDMMFEINPYVEMKEGKTQFIMHATADGNIEAATAWAYYKRSD